jgi:hypothetical protein
MSCPIMSVIFEKVLYLIPIKMPSKRYGRFRAYHAYITLGDYQTVRSPYPPSPHPDDAWCQWEFILFPFFSLDSSNIEN